MKKLMIVAIAMLATIVASASQVKWGFSQTINGQSPAEAMKLDGGHAYLVLQSAFDVSKGTYADLTAAALASADLVTGGNGTTLFNYKATTATSSGLTIAAKEIDANNLANFYVIVTDAAGKNFYAHSGQASVLEDGSITTPTQISPAFFGATSLVASNFSSFAAAPEPTSGLLLLLGVATMALKRKRA